MFIINFLIKKYLIGFDQENALSQYIYKECLQNIVLIIACWFYNLTSLENIELSNSL